MSKEKKQEITWNSITGVMKLYGNMFEFKKKGKTQSFVKYSVSIGKKVDGEYENYYLPVRFAKDVEEPGEGLHTIEIENAFLTFESFEDKEGNTVQKLILMVTDAALLEDEEEEKKGKKK